MGRLDTEEIAQGWVAQVQVKEYGTQVRWRPSPRAMLHAIVVLPEPGIGDVIANRFHPF